MMLKPKAKANSNMVAKPTAKQERRKEVEGKLKDAVSMPRVERPDREAYEKAIMALTENINQLQELARDKTAQISANYADGALSEAHQLKRAEIDALDRKLSELCKTREAWNQVVIERKLETIELRLVRETVSLKDEKLLLKEMAHLKQKQRQHAEETSVASQLSKADADSKIAMIDEECAQVKSALVKKRRDLKELAGQNKLSKDELRKLKDERDLVRDHIQGLIEERSEKREEFRRQQDKHARYLDAKHEEEKRQQKAKREARHKERIEATERRVLEQRMLLLKQTIMFCKNLMAPVAATGTAAENEKKKEVREFETEGLVLLTKKEECDDFCFAPTKRRGPAKNKSASGKGKEGANPKIKHNIATLALFEKLKIVAPMTIDELPATLEQVEQELKELETQTDEVEKQPDKMVSSTIMAMKSADKRDEDETTEEYGAESIAEEEDGDDEDDVNGDVATM